MTNCKYLNVKTTLGYEIILNVRLQKLPVKNIINIHSGHIKFICIMPSYHFKKCYRFNIVLLLRVVPKEIF